MRVRREENVGDIVKANEFRNRERKKIVTIARIAPITNVPTVLRMPQDILHICVCRPDAPFASIGAIPIGFAHNNFVEIVINQATFQMTVHLQTCPWNRQPDKIPLPDPGLV